MIDFAKELLKKYGFQLDTKTNLYQHEIHADQNDELSNEIVFDILHSNDPYMTLSEILDNLYSGYIQHLKSQMQKEVDIALGALSSTNLTALEKRMYFIYPIEHYLQQKFKVNIITDKGHFSLEMTLKDLISLNILIRQKSNKCITIQGTQFPIKLIHSALPDKGER